MPDAVGSDRRPLLAALASSIVVAVFFGWFVTFGPGRWAGREPSAIEALASQTASRPAQTPIATSSVIVPQVATPAPPALSGRSSATGEPSEAEAFATLGTESLRASSSVRFEGQWAAQLASKYVGIVDPLQVTASGSHRFAAVDILAEHTALERSITGAQVLLLDSRTFASGRSNGGAPYWVTVATSPSFDGADKILAWCAAQFPGLSATALNNHCLPTQLKPHAG